jgi:hypothetical protein
MLFIFNLRLPEAGNVIIIIIDKKDVKRTIEVTLKKANFV